MQRRGNKPVGTVARLISLLIVGVVIAIAAIAFDAMKRTSTPARGSQVLPGQVAKQLGQDKASAATSP